MGQKITITVGGISLEAELFDTDCARAVADALPIETGPSEWGEEFYFAVPVNMPLDDTATTGVRVGDIGYWPPGRALAIFFGRTPASTGEDPVPASDVNVVGRVLGDASSLKRALGASKIRIEKK